MNTYIYMRILIQLERERRNLILGGAGEARRVRDVARRRRCRIVGEVNAPSSTSYHYSLSLLHLSFSDRDLISLSRYCLFLLLLSSNRLGLAFAYSFFFFLVCDFSFCYFQLGLVVLTTFTWAQTDCTELGLFFSWSDFLTLGFLHIGWRLGMAKMFQPVWFAMSCFGAMLGLHNCTQF